MAAAQLAGCLGESAAAVITGCVEQLPDAVRDEHASGVEEFLAAQAGLLDVDALRILARRTQDVLDPDGKLTEEQDRHRKRGLDVRQRPDGSASIQGELTAELAELVLTVFDTYAKPVPETDGVKDPRSAVQQWGSPRQ